MSQKLDSPKPSLNTLDHSFLRYAADKQTEKQTAGLERSSHIVGVSNDDGDDNDDSDDVTV